MSENDLVYKCADAYQKGGIKAVIAKVREEESMVNEDWISVDDRLPEPVAHIGGREFVSVIVNHDGLVAEGLYEPALDPPWIVFGVVTNGVTHWMPLPEPPTKKRVSHDS